jgi:hypothetical protein
MLEEIDYSEEFKESKNEDLLKKIDWICCFLSNTAPSYEVIYNKLQKINIKISEKEYKKACKKMGLK